MSDPYKHIRGVLGSGSHNEGATGAAGSTISLAEAQAMGIDVSDLVESATTDTEQPGVEDPKNKFTHVGVRMPNAPKPPVDVRPQVAYGEEGKLVGTVTAVITPVPERQEKGSLPDYEIQYCAQRVPDPSGKDKFDSEAEAKKFVAHGDSVKWYRPDSPDPWESLAADADVLLEAVDALCEKDEDKFERCVKQVKSKNRKEGRPEKGTEEGKGNPWAICHASTDESLEEKDLSYKQRTKMDPSQFVFPPTKEDPDGRYPIPDEAHARNALARVSQHGSPSEKSKVRAAVKKKFPGIEVEESAPMKASSGVVQDVLGKASSGQ